MVILLDGVQMPEPLELTYEWLNPAGTPLRQFVLKYEYLSANEAALLLFHAGKSQGAALSLVNPATQANQSLKVNLHSATVPVLSEVAGQLNYAGITLVLREEPV